MAWGSLVSTIGAFAAVGAGGVAGAAATAGSDAGVGTDAGAGVGLGAAAGALLAAGSDLGEQAAISVTPAKGKISIKRRRVVLLVMAVSFKWVADANARALQHTAQAGQCKRVAPISTGERDELPKGQVNLTRCLAQTNRQGEVSSP